MKLIQGLRAIWRRLRPLRVLPSRDAYAFWAPAYPPVAHNALMLAEEASMRCLMPPLAGLRLLDLACGTGRYGRLALEQGAAQVLGVDNSLPMLKAGVLPLAAQADLSALPLAAQSVDCIVCGLALGHLPRIDRALKEMARVAAPGSLLLVSDLHPLQFRQGAQRSFTAPDGRVYAVEHYLHDAEAYRQAGADAGWHLDVIEDACLEAGGDPVVLVLRFIRQEISRQEISVLAGT